MSVKHEGITALPWAMGQGTTKLAIVGESTIGTVSFPICVISTLEKLDARDLANARYIVQACNHYQDAITALRHVLARVSPPGNDVKLRLVTAIVLDALTACGEIEEGNGN